MHGAEEEEDGRGGAAGGGLSNVPSGRQCYVCGEEGRRGGRVNNIWYIAGVDEIFGQRAKYMKYFFYGGFVLGECGSLFFLPASVIVGYNSTIPYLGVLKT